MAISVSTKAPTGLSIARSGWKYTFSWKFGDANYGAGQVLQYRTSAAKKGKWTAGKLAEFSLKISRVDSQGLDGMTYAEFIREE